MPHKIIHTKDLCFNRKNLIATRHHHTITLHRHFNMWREWVIKQQDQRALQKMQQETRTKMLNLLKAVTEVGLGSAPPSHTPPRERNGTDSKVGDIVHATVYFYIHVVCQCYRNYEMGNLRSKRGSMNSFQNPF